MPWKSALANPTRTASISLMVTVAVLIGELDLRIIIGLVRPKILKYIHLHALYRSLCVYAPMHLLLL